MSRGLASIGIEGVVPYDYDFESALFIDQNGAVSARLSFTKDLLLTQRLILQGRFETNAAVQRVEEFTTGSGLNNLEFGIRLRYDIRRELTPMSASPSTKVSARPHLSCAKMAATRVRFDLRWACGRGFDRVKINGLVRKLRQEKLEVPPNPNPLGTQLYHA